VIVENKQASLFEPPSQSQNDNSSSDGDFGDFEL
jgi:hypothetical protein